MNEADANEYTEALGQVVAGSWRQVALGHRLGVPAALGLTTDQWVQERLGGYVKLNIPTRREAVAELAEEGLSNVAIGEVLGVAESTVRRDTASTKDEVDEPKASDNGGSSRDASPKDEPSPKELKARLAKLPPDLAERVRGSDLDIDEAEAIHSESVERVKAWAQEVNRAYEVLARMAGYPVPDELVPYLKPNTVAALPALLAALVTQEVAHGSTRSGQRR